MAARDILKTISFSASNANVTGQTIELSSCSALSLTVLVSVSAATLVGSVQLTATNDDARAYDLTSTLPALTNGVAITPLPANITLEATGLLTFASPAIGTHEITIAYPAFPKWVRPRYVFGSGGGTVDARVTVAAWSV